MQFRDSNFKYLQIEVNQKVRSQFVLLIKYKNRARIVCICWPAFRCAYVVTTGAHIKFTLFAASDALTLLWLGCYCDPINK
jgi:hypothetical protein